MIKTKPEKKKLITLRIEKGLNQTEAARGIGLQQTTLSMYETGARTPNINRAQQIADFYGVPVEQIDFTGWRK